MLNQDKFTVSGLGKFPLLVFAVFALTGLAGCDLAKNSLKSDRSGNMEIQDFRDGLSQRLPDDAQDGTTDAASADSIPNLQPYVAAPSEKMKSMPLVSISVNQSVPLRDVLFELAEQADYDLELDPNIRGSVIFTARDRPFDQVVDRIADMAGLRYKFEDDVLRVELDKPYNKTYKIDYLSFIRTNKGGIRNNIGVVSGEGTDTGSDFEAKSESESDFWAELELNMKQILGEGTETSLKTKKDPRITATEQNPEVAAVVPTTNAEGQPEVQVQPPQAVLNVESLPVDEEETPGSSGTNDADKPAFAINRQAGIITVFASEKTHKEVADYLQLLRRATTAQVLIEAKVLEVSLNDQYATGIDWRTIDIPNQDFALNFLNPDGLTSLGTQMSELAPSDVNPNFVVGYAGSNVQALVRALSTFGTVKALASPRLTVLNNQSAVMNVATNHVFFEIDIDVTTQDNTVQADVDSTLRNVPEGVLINVQPSIDLDKGTIALSLRPTVTRIINEVPDPAITFAAAAVPGAADIESLVPEVNVQEIDSVIQVRSGQPVVMGGLLQDSARGGDVGVPVLSEIPVAGALFRQHDDTVLKTELVILLKATILDSPGDTIHDTDRDLYRTFSGDRRPFKL